MSKGYLDVKMDISKFIKDLNAMTQGPDSIYRAGGRALREMLLENFEILVKETPQFSGSTAASWQIGFPEDTYGDGTPGSDFVELPKPAGGDEAMRRGMAPAVGIAIARGTANLMHTDPERFVRQAIVVLNNAPGFETAEEGPVRAVNTPPGALKRFEARVATAEIIADFQKGK